MRGSQLLALLLSGLLLLIGPGVSAFAQESETLCPAGQVPTFRFGFAELKERLNANMGLPVECEHGDGSSGDTLQRTTAGMAYYRQRTNTATFTDGTRHWALTPDGLLYWEGGAVEPPAAARLVSPPRSPRPPIPVSGPRDYVFPRIEAPPGDRLLPCLRSNPSCGRDQWWTEWNELQWDDVVQFEFLAPGLVSEYRYVEALWLLWQWPEGQFLLREAANYGVGIFTAPSPLFTAFAGYNPFSRAISVNPRFTQTSTWMVADLLAHELKHAADARAGVLMSRGYADCIAREQSAYSVEHRFLSWLSERFGGLPAGEQVRAQLSREDALLYRNLLDIARSGDPDAEALEDYRRACLD